MIFKFLYLIFYIFKGPSPVLHKHDVHFISTLIIVNNYNNNCKKKRNNNEKKIRKFWASLEHVRNLYLQILITCLKT